MLFDLDGVVKGEPENGEDVDFYLLYYSVQEERCQWLESEGTSIETHKSVLWVSLYDIPALVVSGFWNSATSISKQQKKGCFPRAALSSDDLEPLPGIQRSLLEVKVSRLEYISGFQPQQQI